MIIYNTLTKTKEKFIPRFDKKIQMFVCGPTVYDYIHIGNARTFVFFDVVAKYIHSRGYEVDYIQNITDIDDKIIAKAKENNREPLEYAKEYYVKFKEDMKALGVDSPRYIPATEHIDQVVKQVKTLIDKGFAYKIPGDGWYFDLSKFPEYGKLSGRKAAMANDAVSRIDESDNKKNRGDFVLWKLSPLTNPGQVDHELSWETELGKGRPGWHIEDTAITEHFFGPQYDLHGGGQDLMFPHHEAELTQQESASGKKPFVKYWMHVAFLINKEQKMSKSLGNFETVNELLKKYSKEVLRFYLLSGYYRQPLEFSDKILKQSEAGAGRIYEFMKKLELVSGNGKENAKDYIDQARKQFFEAMDNDFNTPAALAAIFELIRNINPLLVADSLDKKNIEDTRNLLKEIDLVLDVIPPEPKEVPTQVRELVEKRGKLREEKKYEESDKIRAQIHDLGYEIEDTIYGPLSVRIKNS